MNDQTLHNTPPPPAPLSPAEVTAYLDYALDGLLTRRAELIAALDACRAAHPRVDDDETLGDLAENVRMAIALNNNAEARRKETKAPFLDGGRAVDAWFTRFAAPLAAPLAAVRSVMDDYGKRKLALAQAAAEAEFQRQKIEAERAAAEAAAAFQAAPEQVPARLEVAAQAADSAERAANQRDARPAEHTRVRGAYGAVTSMRTRWEWWIDDINQVPRAYLQVNEAAIRDAARARDASGKPTVVIPGIRWVAKQVMGVR